SRLVSVAVLWSGSACIWRRFRLRLRGTILNSRDLHAASLSPAMKAFVERWAAHTGAASVEVVSAEDDARLIEEALAAGEIKPVRGGRYYARSYEKDTARSEERTFVATSNPADKGAFN